ncbi:DUF554 domain-containing protein [Desulfovibrio sp. OttesenSCG-928-C06]|nr:DUF554 domain-containing protein [Desulfovibrio sp. OttesenSCG-928-C06]
MVIPVGSLINCATIILGALLGLMLGNRLTPNLRTIVFQGLGLCVFVIGVQMALDSANILVVIFSILIGGIIGELIGIEDLLDKTGEALKRLLRSGNGTFTQGFVNATMLFCIGSMAILGPLEEGLRGDRSILLTKSLLDGFAAMAFAAAMGTGVIFSALPVLLLQGLITIFAVYLQAVLSPDMILELKATGGILIMGISLNMLELTKIRLSNLLPALPCVVLIVFLMGVFG